MFQKSFTIYLSHLEQGSHSLVNSMTHELEGKDSIAPIARQASTPHWGQRFAASGLKQAPPRREFVERL